MSPNSNKNICTVKFHAIKKKFLKNILLFRKISHLKHHLADDTTTTTATATTTSTTTNVKRMVSYIDQKTAVNRASKLANVRPGINPIKLEITEK